MGLYKLCEHKGAARDRCRHPWWACFRHIRVSLTKWANHDIHTKAEANVVMDQLRAAVRAGTFDARGLEPPKVQIELTFREFAAIYKQRHVLAKGLASGQDIDYRLKPLLQAFGDRRLAKIRTADIEDWLTDLRKPRTVNGLPNRTLTTASINRNMQLLRHMFNWAVGREYLEKTPFRRGTEPLIRKQHEDNLRRRRISEDEEARLLAVAPLHLRAMIITALDTGMRRGEMLALRFTDLDLRRKVITLRGQTTKSKKTRSVPISTARLEAVLNWLRLDAAGNEKPPEALVFSDEIGDPISTNRKIWVLTVLRAHGVTPHWRKEGGWKHVTRECQEAFQRINLHWHDFRHEYASRLVERHVPLAQVRDLLGHASIITTERYDNQTLESLQVAAARLESGKAFDSSDARTEISTASASEERDVDTAAQPSREEGSGRPDHSRTHAAIASRSSRVRSRPAEGQCAEPLQAQRSVVIQSPHIQSRPCSAEARTRSS